jgi:DNA repair exonuclease SbcCD ATPase subunit
LSAVLLALLIAPPIWRRAMLLTRRHVEAETPLTLNEIQAQRDGLRAEHALAERKLELMLDNVRERYALQLAELSEKERLVRNLTAELAAHNVASDELRTSVSGRQGELEQAAALIVEHERLIEQKSAELEHLHRRMSSAAMKADGLQIEVAAQSARIENLVDELKEARQDKRDSDNLRERAEAEIKALQQKLEEEVQRSAELDKRANALFAQLGDMEAKLSRREKEFERVNDRLRKVLADGRQRGGATVLDATRGKAALVQARETELLREEMNALAAQVVAMVARLEGPGSKVNALLESEGEKVPVQDANGEAIVSLADRIRALLAAASKPRETTETR